MARSLLRVLEGDRGSQRDDRPLAALDEHANALMCRLYESRRIVLDLERRVSHDAELLARVRQALISIRQQERSIAGIQHWILAAEE